MTKQELRKGIRVWCWWKSRSLYYTGREYTKDGTTCYVFEDITDAITVITEEQLSKLEIK